MGSRIVLGLVAAALISLSTGTDAQDEVFVENTLINAPTGEVLEEGLWEVRISHRFRLRANEDTWDTFLGVDGGASVFLECARGISDALTASLAKTNFPGYELQFQLKHRVRSPIVATLSASANWNYKDNGIGEKEAYSFVFQGMLPLRIREGLSAVLVPSYLLSLREQAEEILSLGIGLSHDLFEDTPLMIEWFPVLSGDIGAHMSSTWSVGIGKHIGWHDFALVLTNSEGISPTDYLRGGDLDIADREFRLGFNILWKLQ